MLSIKMFFVILAVAFLVTFFVTKKVIAVMRRKNIGQSILNVGPVWHKSKEGTPTMGGIAFIFASLVALLAYAMFFARDMENKNVALLINILVYGVSNGLVGLIDDISKYRKRRNEGLTPMGKLVFQSILTALFLLSLSLTVGMSTSVEIPFTSIELDMGCFYYALAFIVLVGITNAVNLTDGLDGLASTCSLSVAALFAVLGFLTFDNGIYSFFGGLLMGICLAFLIYNLHPARIFMGDTGSLFLGSVIVATGVSTNNLFAVVLYSLVFLCEAFSVIIQVVYFKLSHGKRIFKMAPLHHHFEKCGYTEMKIVSVFGAVSAVCCAAAYFCFI